MKKIFITTLALVIPAMMFGQQDPAFLRIDKVRKDIDDNLNSFAKEESASDSLGSRLDFFSGKDLRKEEINYNDLGVVKRVCWYFSGKTLVYCEQWWTDANGLLVDHEKFYLNHQHLLSWTRNDTQVDPKLEEFSKVDKELVAYGVRLVERAKR